MKTILAIALTILAMSAQAEDMQKYLNETEEMVREGKYEDALRRFIWFHNHALEHEPSMYGVRLSFALSSWKALGDVYPPAKTALVETRDRKKKIILGGKGNFHLFHDVVSLNETLGEGEKTVSLFETLARKQPDTAKRYWDVAKDAVIGAKRYDLAQKYMGDLLQEFTKAKAMYDFNTTLYDNPEIGGDSFKVINENILVDECLKLIEVALALNQRKAAEEIRDKALSVVDDPRLREAIPIESEQNEQ